MRWCFPTAAFLSKQFLVTTEWSLAKEDPLRYVASHRDGGGLRQVTWQAWEGCSLHYCAYSPVHSERIKGICVLEVSLVSLNSSLSSGYLLTEGHCCYCSLVGCSRQRTSCHQKMTVLKRDLLYTKCLYLHANCL